jgi:hypothetical protein
MSDDVTKDQLPSELRHALSVLSDEAQHAASHRFIESGLDPHGGGLSLDEAMVTLSHARDVLADALETGKFVQSPLAVQYDLYGQVQALGLALTNITEGQSTLPDVQARVEKLNAEVWPFRLLDTSADGVMSFHGRMNQLRSQEALIRKTARAAEEFDGLLKNADGMLAEIAERASSIADERASTATVVEQVQALLRESTEIGEQIANLGTQAARQESIASRQLVAARQAFSDMEAVAASAKEAQAEAVAGHESFQALTAQAKVLLAATERTAKVRREEDAQKHAELIKGVSADLAKATTAHQAALAKQLEEMTVKGNAAVDAFVVKSEKALDEGDEEVKGLTEHLEELEGHIDEAMARATSASLLHAFQRRQFDIVRAKAFWARAVTASVLLLLGVVGYVVYALPSVPTDSAVFYGRLSIAVLLIVAVGFCGIRFSGARSREREFNESVPPGLQEASE